MIEVNNQSKDVGQFLKPLWCEYTSGHGLKIPYKNSSMFNVEGTGRYIHERV